MVVYLVTSIFETEPGQFKKYTMAYDSLDAALEYVELDMAAQYEGIYAEVLTDDIKELVRMREDFFFKYGQMPHYIMIERLDVHSALPENVDNVVRFSLSEHMIEPVVEAEEAAVEEEEEEEMAAEEEAEEMPSEEEKSPEANLEFNGVETPAESSNENTIGIEEESGLNEETVEPPVENNSVINSGEDIHGLEEEEEMPSPETMNMENSMESADENMESNMPSSNENIDTSAEAEVESNIPAALRTATGGKLSVKRSTRRKGGKGKRKSRKI
jgi:hypothetical protein